MLARVVGDCEERGRGTKGVACRGVVSNNGTFTVKPPIKDTLKEDKPPNKGQAEMYTHSIENHL